ncbi:hypothetical protein POTOM_059984 [Populus tomentosa]|uniref:THO complex subunitTHOC2 C-terminal domain-containing protein n=1 Tax=Populus tomentosa TaxID=118781 RepID=A0A8X8C0R4_POPTO|nr:hypothetical protein POTOM_059984 [Populus tomentosa]
MGFGDGNSRRLLEWEMISEAVSVSEVDISVKLAVRVSNATWNIGDCNEGIIGKWYGLKFEGSLVLDISDSCQTCLLLDASFIEYRGTGGGDWSAGYACGMCKKYPSMELRGLFQYLGNQLKKGQGIELVLLQWSLMIMSGASSTNGNVQYTENLTEEQLDAMAGSETLRYQATSFGVTRNNKALFKSANRLRDSLLPKDEPKPAIPLLLLIAQHRSVVVINADAPYIKMVSEQFDRCHGTLLQYVEFLCSAVTPPSAYAQLIPSLDDLVHLYHLDPEVAFLIYRPVMRLFKCAGSLDVFWPLENNKTVTNTSAILEPEAIEYSGGVILDLGSSHKSVTNRYESEIAKQHAALKALEELSDNSSSAITKGRKRRKGFNESLTRLHYMPDAVYCAMFVHTLHSLGTPFFNTVNHVDVLICKTLQPMICCCTEYEAGRLGRFLYETLKIAYYWKSDESIYEHECGNMPGFAVYYRFPNSQRVTYGQFIKDPHIETCHAQEILKSSLSTLEMESENVSAIDSVSGII